MTSHSDRTAISQLHLFWRFLKFGFLAWGGPVAQIAMLKRELVDEKRWLDAARFNRLLAVYQVLPGPEAHELCVHLGMMRGGRVGGLLAGLAFMLPGFLLILAIAWLYGRIDLSQPTIAAMFFAVQVGVVAIIVRAVHRIGDHVLTNGPLWLVAGLTAGAALLDVPFWISLPTGALVYLLLAAGNRLGGLAMIAFGAGVAFLAGLGQTELASGAPRAPAAVAAGMVSASALFLSGLKAGLLTFGGAYTAIPFVRDDTVGRGWVSEGQFLDSVALSGIIPAPLIIFATFVGYQAGGFSGALAITAGIFLPAFSFALLFYDKLERLIEDQRLNRFLEGIAAGVVGLIAVTAIQLGLHIAKSAPSLVIPAVIFTASLALLYLWNSKFNLIAVIATSALAGTIIQLSNGGF